MEYKVLINKKEFLVKLKKSGKNWIAQVGKETFTFEQIQQLSSTLWAYQQKRKEKTISVHVDEPLVSFWHEDEKINTSVQHAHLSQTLANQTHHKIQIRSVMPGLIKKIHVHEGDRVKKGEPLIVLEAMKMENEINAHEAGLIQTIHVKENQSVENNTLLIEIKA